MNNALWLLASTLTARDETTGEIAQFRIPRINGVAPSLTILENKADLDL